MSKPKSRRRENSGLRKITIRTITKTTARRPTAIFTERYSDSRRLPDFVAYRHAVVFLHRGPDSDSVVVGAVLDIIQKILHRPGGANHVVADDHGAWFELWFKQLEVFQVILFQSIDENEVELAFERRQRFRA